MLLIVGKLLAIPVVDILAYYGVDVPAQTVIRHEGRVSINCPFHEETKPSFMIYLNQNTAYCFGCAKKFDGVSIVQSFEGGRFTAAMHKLAEIGGLVIAQDIEKEVRDQLQQRHERNKAGKSDQHFRDVKFRMVSEFTTWMYSLPKRQKFWHLTDWFYDILEEIGEEKMGVKELDKVKDTLVWGRKFFIGVSLTWLLFNPKPNREDWGARTESDLGA